MKICLLELIQQGGMVHYASQLSNALVEHDDIDVYLIIAKGTDCSYFKDNINIRTIPIIGRHPFRIDLILKHILSINPDIIHVTIRHPFIIPLIPLLKIRGYPIYFTLHDIRPHPGEKLSLISSISSNIMLRCSNNVFIHGYKLKTDLMKMKISAEKIKVIPHGDYSFFEKSKKYKKNICQEENTILFFGRILDYKGLEYLIKAESIISKSITNLKIIIAGEGDFSKYEPLVKGKKNIKVINRYVPDDEVSELFGLSSIVVLPYVEASQSGVVPIAYSFKKPVVVTNVGSLSEIVENNVTGFVVAPRDYNSIAEAIIKLLKNPKLRAEFGENAYAKMKRDLSWSEIARQTIDTYKCCKKS